MMLFLDIETLPAPSSAEPVLRELYERRPGRASTFADYLRGTSLNGNWGQVFCIGVAQDDAATKVLSGTETELLNAFWTLAKDATRFVGHNAREFDVPFLWKRSVIHAIRPSIPQAQLTDPAFVFDTMREWACVPTGRGSGSYPYTGLHELAKVLGLESSKQGIDGSQVFDYWRAGKFQEIYDYCARDVALTRQIFKRLTFNH